MAYDPPKSNSTLGTYLNQWVNIASGGRVKLSGGMNLSSASVYTNTGCFIFICTQCKDNWYVGPENFHGNVQDPAAETSPSVLSDWVKKHRHVCKKFKPWQPLPTCFDCKWPYGAHEESWAQLPMMAGGQSAYFDKDGNSLGGPAPKGMTLKQFTGRKFRDTEETCASPDTNIEKTSNE